MVDTDARGERSFGDEAIERIVFRLLVEDGGDCFLDGSGAIDQRLGIGPRLQVEQEVVDRPQPESYEDDED